MRVCIAYVLTLLLCISLTCTPATGLIIQADQIMPDNPPSNPKLDEAEIFLNESKTLIMKHDCLNATDRINKAKKIYAGLYEQADNTDSQEHYLALIKDSDDVIKRIENTCRSPRIQEIGEDYYRMAQSKYLAGDYTASMEYANKALEIYTNTKNYVGISKSNTLIILIGKNVGEDQAKERIEAEKLLDEATKQKQKLDLANKHYTKSKQFFDSKDWANSLSNAVLANQLYTELNYPLGISESAKMIDASQKNIAAEDAEFRNMIFFAFALILFVGFLIMLFIKRRQKTQKELTEKNEKL